MNDIHQYFPAENVIKKLVQGMQVSHDIPKAEILQDEISANKKRLHPSSPFKNY